MSIAKNFEYDCENLLVDEESWTCFLEPAFHEQPNAAESLGALLFIIKEALGRGPKGVTQASNTLSGEQRRSNALPSALPRIGVGRSRRENDGDGSHDLTCIGVSPCRSR